MLSFFTQNQYGNTDTNEKFTFLRKVFPTIQMGRDIDLEMYIQLRSGGKSVDKWKRYYDQLVHKYTPDERKILIHVLRKYNHDFNRVFSLIIDKLYKRLLKSFEQKIDRILKIIGGINSENVHTEREKIAVVDKIKQSLEVCSLNHARALDDIDLLEYFANTFGYKTQLFLQAADLVKLYLNGLLFIEKTEYQFDIREEKRKHLGIMQNNQPEQPAMRLYITRADLEKMIVDETLDNEYDLAFAFYEKYFGYVGDVNFANKIFLYSQTYKTNHYRIFECMKQGIVNRFRKDRIYDDIFKIICAGRYIYDINKEKQIQYRIWLFSKAVNKAERMERMQQRRKKLYSAVAGKIPAPYKSVQPSALSPAPAIIPPAAAESVPAREKEPETNAGMILQKKKQGAVRPTKQPAYDKPAGHEKKLPFYRKAVKTSKTVTEMIAEIAENPADKQMLVDEFKNRFSGFVLKYFQDIPGVDIQREEDLKRFKDFIKYALHNYDTIITDRGNEKKYDRELKSFGFNISLFYTIIFECFMNVKSDYLLNHMHRRVFPGIKNFFSRLFGRRQQA